MNIDVYQYVASNDPRASKRIIENFGYNLRGRDLAQNLRELVNNEGESAVAEIMKYHPDAEYFEDNFSNAIGKKSKSKKRNSDLEKFLYMNATGSNQVNKPEITASQTNTIILAAAMLITIAIITKK